MPATSIMKHHNIFLSLVLIFVATLSTEARADLYDSWTVIEGNSSNPGTIAAQLSVEVTDPGNDQVLFTFKNTGSHDSFIADIYFDDGALLGISNIINSSDVLFLDPASPANVPGGNNVNPDFVASGDFSADFSKGAANGVNNYDGFGTQESVGILFDLKNDMDFGAVIKALNVGFNPDTYYYANGGIGPYDGWDEPSLRIALHIQGTGANEDYSDTFILTPVPPSLIIGILGICVAGVKLRKFA